MAATDKLTDPAVRNAKPEAKPYKLADGGGLFLLVQPNGAKWWRLKYRLGGKEKLLSVGVYPETGLKLARSKRDEARKALAAGADPGAERKSRKEALNASQRAQQLMARGEALPGTFEAVAREWWASVHCAKVSANHAARTLTRLEQDAFPWIGTSPIAMLKAADVLRCAQRVVERGAIETAHRLKDACGQVFRYGVAKSLCDRNPVPDLKDALPPVVTRHLAAVTEPAKVGELLRAMDGYQGHPVTRAALLLSPLVFLRPGELRQLEWAWNDWDDASMSLPSTLMNRSKNEKAKGKPHFVPLAPQALALLRDLQPLTGSGRFVFPSVSTSKRPISDNTVRSALRRLGYGNDDMSAHGFRAMARTMADEQLEVPAHVIEAQLAHGVADELGTAYNRTQHMQQRRELMTRWADYLGALKTGAKVLPFKAA